MKFSIQIREDATNSRERALRTAISSLPMSNLPDEQPVLSKQPDGSFILRMKEVEGTRREVLRLLSIMSVDRITYEELPE